MSYRPAFHFTAKKNWINDPNGLVFLDGEYHLFFQHNPSANTPGNIGWGHAVSSDLLHWTELEMALPFQNSIMAFSGSVVVDTQNSSGFGTDALIALFTAHHTTKSLEAQHLAHSTDHGRTWQLYAGNPVLDIGQADFRDPKVFWHKPSQRWVMLVVLPFERIVQFYTSSNLKNWLFSSQFGSAGSVEGIWEVPDLFELLLDGVAYWVLKVDVGSGGLFGGSGGQYFIGQFDGQCFVTESLETNWLDFGKDFYAALSFNNLGSRRVWLAWMNNWQYAALTPTAPWRGAMSLPRELSLWRDSRGLRLRQLPIAELEQRRVALYSETNVVVQNQHLPLAIRGQHLEIMAEFTVQDAPEFGLKVCVGANSQTTIGYQTATQEVFVDRRQTGDFCDLFAGRYTARLEQTKLRLHIFIDSCSLEVFVQHGEVVFTTLIFPEHGADALELYALGGRVELSQLSIWTLL